MNVQWLLDMGYLKMNKGSHLGIEHFICFECHEIIFTCFYSSREDRAKHLQKHYGGDGHFERLHPELEALFVLSGE